MSTAGSPNMLSALLVVGGLGIFLAISKAFYNLFLHPLRSYPGPWYASASIFWASYHGFNGNLTFRVHELHKKYGSVVRIAPDELSYIDPQAWKDIWGHRNGVPENPKIPAILNDPDKAHPTIISADREQHAKLRRLLSNAFSDKSMREQEPVIKYYVDLLIERLRDVAAQNDPKGTDLVKWLNFTTFDVIAHLTFAEPLNCLQNSEIHPWIEFMFAVIKFSGKMTALRRINDRLGALVKNLIPARIREHREKLYTLTNELVMRRRAIAPSYTDFMTHLLSAEKSGKLTMPDVLAQAPTLVIAGSETTATLLSGGTFHLLTNPRVYERVATEIRSKFSDQSEINVASINELKYLLAFFDEALRIYPPAANNLPRYTPPGGAVIMGKWVPGGTVVGIHQYAAFHSSENFADPDTFAPERFLDTGNPKWVNDKRDALQPFSFGPRNCIGRNLAYHEMRLILASILLNFDMELVPGQDNWLDQRIYAVWDKHPLMVRFKPVKR